jgi:hypothetical protein
VTVQLVLGGGIGRGVSTVVGGTGSGAGAVIGGEVSVRVAMTAEESIAEVSVDLSVFTVQARAVKSITIESRVECDINLLRFVNENR